MSNRNESSSSLDVSNEASNYYSCDDSCQDDVSLLQPLTVEQSCQCDEKMLKNESHAPLTRDFGCQVDEMVFGRKSLAIDDIIQEDKQLNALTGISTLLLLGSLVKALEKFESVTDQKKKLSISLKHRIILTFMILKMNITYASAATLLQIKTCSVKRYFEMTLSQLKLVLGVVIRWPCQEEILNNMPRCFEKYKNTRVVLDCTEVPIQRTKCLQSRLSTYSTYKSTHIQQNFLLAWHRQA